ncbi:hypothetical protein RFI_39159 [Reticulomyxa filosa]|uniref:Uncharacterized protein n=1 Tax=Reticulomyxa filosa TaxID=46433 RepID=X6L9Z7_RETFI|nr:hypothetical protein RFI_39159 [Reticulomyxa filosa]|eukprot:ETN98348.1 hypothetical protein RFI_39159 [Reticulomyxa filosa]
MHECVTSFITSLSKDNSFFNLLNNFFKYDWDTVLAYSFLKIKISPTTVIPNRANNTITWKFMAESGYILTDEVYTSNKIKKKDYSGTIETEFNVLPLIILAAALDDEYSKKRLIKDVRMLLNSFINPSSLTMEDMYCGLILLRLNALQIRESIKMNPSTVSLAEVFAAEKSGHQMTFNLVNDIERKKSNDNLETFYSNNNQLEHSGLYTFKNGQEGFDMLFYSDNNYVFCQVKFIDFDTLHNKILFAFISKISGNMEKYQNFDSLESLVEKFAADIDYQKIYNSFNTCKQYFDDYFNVKTRKPKSHYGHIWRPKNHNGQIWKLNS